VGTGLGSILVARTRQAATAERAPASAVRGSTSAFGHTTRRRRATTRRSRCLQTRASCRRRPRRTRRDRRTSALPSPRGIPFPRPVPRILDDLGMEGRHVLVRVERIGRSLHESRISQEDGPDGDDRLLEPGREAGRRREDDIRHPSSVPSRRGSAALVDASPKVQGHDVVIDPLVRCEDGFLLCWRGAGEGLLRIERFQTSPAPADRRRRDRPRGRRDRADRRRPLPTTPTAMLARRCCDACTGGRRRPQGALPASRRQDRQAIRSHLTEIEIPPARSRMCSRRWRTTGKATWRGRSSERVGGRLHGSSAGPAGILLAR